MIKVIKGRVENVDYSTIHAFPSNETQPKRIQLRALMNLITGRKVEVIFIQKSNDSWSSPAWRMTVQISITLSFLYAASFIFFYENKVPASNLMYFVYLRGGQESEIKEQCLYYFYFPIYRLNCYLGGVKHNYDRTAPVDAG